MSDVWTIAVYGLREAMRRRVFIIVLVLTLIFLGLFALATNHVFHDVEPRSRPLPTSTSTLAPSLAPTCSDSPCS